MEQILYIDTQRLELLPCSLEVAQATLAKDKPLLEKLLTAYIPDDWYNTEVQAFLPKYIELLKSDPSQLGYGVWLIIRTDDSTLVGDLGFEGKSDDETLEIGYEILAAYRNEGYATEAVEALIDFAFTQLAAKKIIAHTPIDNVASIRVLEKLGMQNVEKMKGTDTLGLEVYKWELTLESRNS
ncbi:N-acetyltransferase [Dulcicalothrix desertica PCC 7102]|uniref:N-acetyltransferase n=1 Tax=Dulcicalothrix desertica PCC 7102 TaxID=232991 RepID=A0A433VED3_9CYAN|nr:GNAT family N-acetyltransferase [Dulcicalothrix desertica]RUT04448.1 N-acetyltransferase [Dulcicalothrix desertica PCC 7102]TWH51298.1 ribosomal-protein-alanine N-acetyltransferase [Dulcicalothrix desertica PCC 7102]